MRELGPVSTHDVLASWRGVWVETKGRGGRFRQQVSDKFTERVARKTGSQRRHGTPKGRIIDTGDGEKTIAACSIEGSAAKRQGNPKQ